MEVSNLGLLLTRVLVITLYSFSIYINKLVDVDKKEFL